jgi:chitin disaccharide deacetylase
VVGQVILNADDFGLSDETVRATIECFTRGALTSATIMTNMPATGLAVEFARQSPQFSFGAHLTLVDEWPMSDPQKIPDLVDAGGRLLSSQQVRLRAMVGDLCPNQVEHEISAQLSFLFDSGLPVSHVDSHGHLHKFAAIRTALQRVLPRFGIKRVRNAQDIYLHHNLTSPTYWYGPRWRRQIVRRFTTTDHFAMPRSEDGPDWPRALLTQITEDTMEVGVHPGYEEQWRDEQRSGVQQLARLIRALDLKLVSWNAV